MSRLFIFIYPGKLARVESIINLYLTNSIYMKKIFFLIVSYFVSINTLAQPGVMKSDTAVKETAKNMCNCLMPSLDTLHPRAKEFIKDILLFGQNSASMSFNKWIDNASEKERANISGSVIFLQEPKKMDSLMKLCFSRVKANYPVATIILEDTALATSEQLVDFMFEEKNCWLLGYVFRISMTDVTSPRPGEPFNNIKLDKRTYKVDKFLNVEEDTIHIKLYSNSVIDGDSISVYLNYNTVAEYIKLSKKPFQASLCVSGQENNVLAFYAENLGTKPPNTALLEIKHGTKVEKVIINTDLENNVSVIITYQKK